MRCLGRPRSPHYIGNEADLFSRATTVLTSPTPNFPIVFRNKKLYVGNVGDSRCIACCSGLAEPLSTDHKPGDALERERIEQVGPFFLMKCETSLFYFSMHNGPENPTFVRFHALIFFTVDFKSQLSFATQSSKLDDYRSKNCPNRFLTHCVLLFLGRRLCRVQSSEWKPRA